VQPSIAINNWRRMTLKQVYLGSVKVKEQVAASGNAMSGAVAANRRRISTILNFWSRNPLSVKGKRSLAQQNLKNWACCRGLYDRKTCQNMA
jgi:hypothetical protein